MNIEHETKRILDSSLSAETKANAICKIVVFNKQKLIEAINYYGTGTPKQWNMIIETCSKHYNLEKQNDKQ